MMGVDHRPNDNVEAQQSILGLQRHAARGALVLLGRTAIVQGITITATIVLARLLTPAEFGIYAIVALITAFFTAFSDVGLGAALIQQADEPSRQEFDTVFALQIVLLGIVLPLGLLCAAPLSQAYNLEAASAWLIRVLLLTLPIGLLRTVPALLLERHLSYGRLSLVESSETVVFYVLTMALAASGYGVWSFVWATAARALVGALIAQIVMPWRPGLHFSMGTAKRLVQFGLPFQMQAVLNVIKEAMTPTALALLVGATAVGYINWSYTVATAPLLVTSILARVTFPAFARVQHDTEVLKQMVERSIRLTAIVFLPISCLLMGAGEQVVIYIFTDKWLPALPAFYLFSLSLWTGPLLGASFFSLFYATNHSRTALSFVLLYTFLDWIVGVPLVLWFGFTGIAIRNVVVAYATLPALIWAVHRIIPVRIGPQLVRALAVAVLSGGVEYGLLRILPAGLSSLIIAAAIGATCYGAVIAFLERAILCAVGRELLPPRVKRVELIRRYLAVPA